MEANCRVLVGPDSPERDTILADLINHDSLVLLDTPNDLGNYLKQL
jgi:hypothetical protein